MSYGQCNLLDREVYWDNRRGIIVGYEFRGQLWLYVNLLDDRSIVELAARQVKLMPELNY